MELGGELRSRRLVIAERLLDDDPRSGGQIGLGQALHDLGEEERRDLEVEDRELRPLDGLAHCLVGGGRREVALDVGEPPAEPAPHLLVDLLPGGLDALPGMLPKVLDRPVVAGHPDHGAAQQTPGLQPIQRPEGHHPGQIAGDAEDHQHVRRLTGQSPRASSCHHVPLLPRPPILPRAYGRGPGPSIVPSGRNGRHGRAHRLAEMPASTAESSWQGERGIVLRAGDLSATFLPDVGMTGVSLEYRGREHLAVPGGAAALEGGATGGLPLLAPWANRLASWHYTAAGIDVDLDGLDLDTDDNGLPIHGLLVGQSGWSVGHHAGEGNEARLTASIDVDAGAFPFPHRIELSVEASDQALTVDTTVVPTARRPVPVAFGWHPYLQLPNGSRAEWTLELPARRHLALDGRGIPTGAEEPEPAEAAAIGGRTFDDLYALGRDRRLGLRADDGSGIELRSDAAYPFAQVWVPAGRDFAALEPMTAPTNSLATGCAPLVEPGEAYTARFTLTFT